MVAAQIVRASYHAILPAALELARWVAPLLMVGWAIASGIGRAFVLRALVPQSRLRAGLAVLLQLLRVVALALTGLVWFAMVRWAAARDIIACAAWHGAQHGGVRCVAHLPVHRQLHRVGAVELGAVDRECLIVAEDRSLLSALAASVRLGPLTMNSWR